MLVINNQEINSYSNMEIKSIIDQLTIDLNKELFIISEEIHKFKRGLSGNIDCKRSKKKVCRLEEETNKIIAKVNAVMD